jgi:hypothetical protein
MTQDHGMGGTPAGAGQPRAGEDRGAAGRLVLTRYLLPPSDGPSYRQLTLELDATGDLILTAHEMGASLEAAWGADDQERTLSVPREAVGRLAFDLLAAQLAGRSDAFDQLASFCEDHGLAHTLACWT